MIHSQLRERPIPAGGGRLAGDPLAGASRRDGPPHLQLVDAVHHQIDQPDVSQELARCPVLDGKKRVAVPILVFDPLPDPGPGLVYRERMRVKAHVVGIGLDGVERLQVEEVPSEGSQSKAVGL